MVVVNAALDLRRELPLTNVVWAYFEPSAPAALLAAPESVPEAWSEQDIGRVLLRGSTRHASGVFTLRSAGVGIRAEADSHHYVYRPVEGDIEMVARIVTVHQTHSLAMAGLMMRAGLDASSPQITVGLTPGGRGVILRREQAGAGTQAQTYSGWGVPCWLRLRREGNSFVVYQSRNGCRWSFIDRLNLSLPRTFNVGLASTSGMDTTVNWSSFDQVAVGANLCNTVYPPRVELTSGSVVVGRPVSPDGGRVEVGWGLTSVTVPARCISRLVFQWPSPEWLSRLPPEQGGVWLANGEFMEGDFRGVDLGQVRVSSVLYGSKTLDANAEVLMVALQPSQPCATRFQVATVNGSVFRAVDLALGDNELIVQEPVLGRLTIPIQALAFVSRL